MTSLDPPLLETPIGDPAVLTLGVVGAPDVLTPVRRGTWRRAAPRRVLLAVAFLGAGAGVVLRFVTASSLWLDEALTVNISKLPLAQLLAALRHDGSPPAYYLLLHVWMKVFGSTDAAVRALPAVLSVLTLGAAWALGKAVGGRTTAPAMALLVATSPFAIRYGSENRPYALVVLLATLGGLALVLCLREPTPRRLVAVGVAGGLLLLTHYWALYLIGAAGAVLLFGSLRGTERVTSRLTLAALASGSLMFLPWGPSFLYQMAHTGTPWSTPASPAMFLDTLGEFTGWHTRTGTYLFALYLALFASLFALVAISVLPAGRRLALRLRLDAQVPGERWVAPIGALAALALFIAFTGALVTGAAFAVRYSSVVLPPVVLLAALATSGFTIRRGGRAVQAGVLAAATLLGVPAGATLGLSNRTQASVVADRLRALARPGDVIVYCPDQLGPAVSRLLPNRYVQVTFPRFDPPQRVDWVDYAKVNAQAPPPGLAAKELLNLAGPGQQIWLVYEIGYRTFGHDCEELRDSLEFVRPNFTQPVTADPGKYYEHESLMRFAAY